MKIKEILDTTTNSRVYKMALKWHRENKGLIHCAICPYHDNENYVRHGKDNRNWKRYRKNQFKS